MRQTRGRSKSQVGKKDSSTKNHKGSKLGGGKRKLVTFSVTSRARILLGFLLGLILGALLGGCSHTTGLNGAVTTNEVPGQPNANFPHIERWEDKEAVCWVLGKPPVALSCTPKWAAPGKWD